MLALPCTKTPCSNLNCKVCQLDKMGFLHRNKLWATIACVWLDVTVWKKNEKKKQKFSSFGQPTRLITCANHGNIIIFMNSDSWYRYYSTPSSEKVMTVVTKNEISISNLLAKPPSFSWRFRCEVTLIPLHNDNIEGHCDQNSRQRTANRSACSNRVPTSLHARDYSQALGSLCDG